MHRRPVVSNVRKRENPPPEAESFSRGAGYFCGAPVSALELAVLLVLELVPTLHLP